MKILVYLKDPDGFWDGVIEAARESVDDLGGKLTREDRILVEEKRSREAWGFINQWVEYKECVLLEFDTEAKTATVVARPKP